MRVRGGLIAATGMVMLAVACRAEPAAAPPPTTQVTTSPSARPPSSRPSTPGPSRSPSAPAPTPSTQTPRPTPTKLPSFLLGTDWETIPTSSKVVALTFDGGASDDAVTPILATLAVKRVPATFFLTGDFATTFPAASRAIAAAGHLLGNHSMTHPYFTQLTSAQIRAQLSGAEAAIQRVTGRSPRPLFRFPYGDRNARTITAVNDLGHVAVRWTVDTLGWKGTTGGQSVGTVLDRSLDALTPGVIVLMHVGANPDDGSTLDADALPRVIDAIRARGYSFVTLDALLTRAAG